MRKLVVRSLMVLAFGLIIVGAAVAALGSRVTSATPGYSLKEMEVVSVVGHKYTTSFLTKEGYRGETSSVAGWGPPEVFPGDHISMWCKEADAMACEWLRPYTSRMIHHRLKPGLAAALAGLLVLTIAGVLRR